MGWRRNSGEASRNRVGVSSQEGLLATHGLIRTLKKLDGNVKGVVLTEPLWGIPFNLYAPYVSVYMLALGAGDVQIGMIVTMSTVAQVFWTLMAGAITDKLGRKRTTLIFDLISWSVPCLIWAVAQNPLYFYVAAFVNAVWRVTDCSWGCLVVEDTDPDLLVDVWSWIHISGLLAAFVAPLSGLVVGRFGLVPTMRGLYLFSFVMMTAKAVVMNALVTETTQGRIRMQETANEGFFTVLRGLGDVMRQIAKSPSTLYVLALMLVLNIAMTVRGSFWSILASQELGVSDVRLALYPAVRSVTMLAFFFLGMPRIRRFIAVGERDERLPMIAGFGLAVVSQVILTVVAPGAEWLLLVATMLEGCSIPLTSTLLQKITATTVDAHERARVMSMLTMVVLIVSSPFGWLAGELSAVNRRLPFVLAAVLLGVGAVLTYLASRAAEKESAARVAAAAG